MESRETEREANSRNHPLMHSVSEHFECHVSNNDPHQISHGRPLMHYCQYLPCHTILR